MARGVTQDQVTRAADALLARGERPTIEKVRVELGTGSPNTLLRLLEVWWAELAGRLDAQARAQLPGVPEPVQRAMMTLWSEAVVETRRDAEARLCEREQVLAAREADVQHQLEAARSADVTVKEERSRAIADLAHAATALEQERRHAAALQGSLSEAVQSLRDAQVTIEALRRAGEEALRRYRTDLERTTAGEQRWLTEVDRAREETKAALQDAKRARAELAKERQQRLKLDAQHTAEKREFRQKTAALEKELKAQARRHVAAGKPLQPSPHGSKRRRIVR